MPRTEQQWAKKVQEAGYAHKRAQVGEVNFSYVEGPDNGAPLVLLHAVDYQGHGEATQPADHLMNVGRIGTDLATFIEQEIGSTVNISGNSSGGLIAMWLGDHGPDRVQEVVLEDPPLFASEYPRIKQTVAIKAFESSFTAVRDGYGDDFLMYWLDNNNQSFNRRIFPGSAAGIKAMVVAHRALKRSSPSP